MDQVLIMLLLAFSLFAVALGFVMLIKGTQDRDGTLLVSGFILMLLGCLFLYVLLIGPEQFNALFIIP